MFDLPIGEILDAMTQAPARHSAMVHFPIVVSMLGLLGLLGLALTKGQSKKLCYSCVAIYVIGASTAWIAHGAGEDALALLDTSVMTESALERIDTHESMGEQVWIWLAVTAAITAIAGLINQESRLKLVVLALAVLVATGTAIHVVVTAHHGGTLVYQYGVGTPTSPNNHGRHGVDLVPDGS